MSLKNNKIVKEDVKKIINNVNQIEKLKNKTVYITGINGMIATYLVYTLSYLNEKENYNIKIIGLTRNEEKSKKLFSEVKNLQLIVQDVCEPIEFEYNVDYIIHAAGNASPNAIIHNPTDIIKTNTIGTINTLEVAKKYNLENIIYLSTREIYGKVNSINQITEEQMGYIDPMEVRSCYPESKRMGENIFVSYGEQYNIPYNIIRIAHSYGPGMNINKDGRIMSDMISNAVNNDDIIFYSDRNGH